jgi:4-hydroxy-2-oxoheptanedioate aldolase
LLPRIEIVEMLRSAGFDAVIIDLEHGATAATDLPPLVAAAHGAGLLAAVRVGEGSAAEIGHALDAGADAILMPHVGGTKDARRLVDAGRYPPIGNRSLNPYTRGNRYGSTPDPYDAANRRIALVAMLEGVDAVSNLEKVAALEEIDAIFVGPMDLSGSLGQPGNVEHPVVVEAVHDVIARAQLVDTAVGVYANTPEAAVRWFAAGAALVALSADIAMAADGFAAVFNAVEASPARLAARPTAPG